MFHWSPLSTPPAGEKQYRIQYTAISCTIIETNSNRCDHVFPIRPAAALDSNYADYAVVKTAVFRCSSSWQQLSAAVVTAASALIAAALSEVTVASAIYVEVLQWWHVTAASAEVTATLLYMRGQLRQPSMLKYWLVVTPALSAGTVASDCLCWSAAEETAASSVVTTALSAVLASVCCSSYWLSWGIADASAAQSHASDLLQWLLYKLRVALLLCW